MQKKILIVSATSFEIEILKEKKLPYLDFYITGVGMVNTALALSQVLKSPYDWVVNVGVAGVYDHVFELGQVVEVLTDRYGDMGAEEANGHFLDMKELGLIDTLYYENKNQISKLRPANGLTVNKVHGMAASIRSIQQKYPHLHTESMEGAAFFQTCEMMKVEKYAQIRAISNHVEPRNREKWEMKKAIENLNNEVGRIIEEVVNN